MSKLLNVFLFILVLCLMTLSASAANFFDGRLKVIDSANQDEVFGGSAQSTLIITFTPGGLKTEADKDDGRYFIIIDTNDDGDFDDESIVDNGDATNGSSVRYHMDKPSLADGRYEVAVVISDDPGPSLKWDSDWDMETEVFVLDTTLDITEVAVDPGIFSPNGDGVRDTTTIYYTLSENLSGTYSDITITIGEGKFSVPAKPSPGKQQGRNTVVWDGKDGLGKLIDDGEYTIKIEAYDRGGNTKAVSTTVKIRTKAPEVASTVPAKDSFVSVLSEVTAQLKDNSGEGINLANSTIRLRDISGNDIAGSQYDDGATKIGWKIASPLPGDGSKDGQYTIVIRAVDKIGNSANISYTFYYDTVFPNITSVTPANNAVLTVPPANIVIVMNDGTGSGSDLSATARTLAIDSGSTAGSAVHNGLNTITFTPFTQFTRGIHTIEISPTDFAGNKPTQPIKFQFGYFENASDILPEVSSTDPADNSFKNAITKVSATLKDNSGKGLDLNVSTIRLEGPSNAQISGRQTDDKNQTITYELTSPIPTDGSVDGIYTIKVKAADKSAGSKEYSYTFLYDTKIPLITSITPANKSIITTSLTDIVIKVDDRAGSGLNFAASKSSMKLKTQTGEITNIIRQDNGIDTMTFTFPALENTGEYTIEIKLEDRAGNQQTYQSVFDFVKKETDILPEVVSTDPSDRSLKNLVTKVSAILKDNSGKGIDLDASTIRLENPANSTVAGVQTDDGNLTINWELSNPLPADGSVDGIYTIKVKAADKAGRLKDYSYAFTYDTQVPLLTLITPANRATITATTLTEIFIMVTDGLGSGVDFASSRTSMKLSMNGKEVPNILRKDNGIDTMTFSFPALEDTGRYTIEIKLKDRAGNEYTYQSWFDFVEKSADVLPEVVNTDPSDRTFINSLTKVSAVLKDNSSKGLDLDASIIRLESPDGVELAGYQTNDKNQTIIWELATPLPTNGSVDGLYTIKIKAVDKRDGSKESISTFTYDTKVPVLTSITPSNGSVLTSALTEIVVKAGDGTGSGLDFAATRSSMKLALEGKEISNILRSDDGVNTMTFSFAALEDTGKYTIQINLKDRAGNEYAYLSRFDYVAKTTDVLPEVTSTDPVDRSFSNTIMKVSAVLKDNSGKGIDLGKSIIRLKSGESEIPGTQIDDNNQTIIWELLAPLPTDGSADGIYTISIKAVDKTGGIKEQNNTFLYDTKAPTLISITPDNGSIMTETLSGIIVKAKDETGSGVDFVSSRSSMKLYLDGKEISNIARSDNGIDTINFGFSPLEDYGKYSIEIKLKDRAGNEYTYLSKFDYVKSTTEALPEVVSTDPADKSFKNAVLRTSALLKDNSGKGLDMDASTIRLEDPSGIELSGYQTNDKNQTITWELQNPLPTNGSVDGMYTIKIIGVDKSGGIKEYSYTFFYDTQIPSLVSIEPENSSILTTAPSQVVVKVSDGTGSGLNFVASRNSMKLLLDSKEISNISKNDNGVDTLTFGFAPLEDTGRYTVEIKLSDRAGNEFVYQTRFDYVKKITEALPEVSSTDPPDKSFRNSVSKVTAVLEDKSGKGIDFDLSTIRLEGPDGVEIGGRQTDDNSKTLAWELANPLLTDGTMDGTYTIKVNAVDNAGASSEYSYTFLYDSKAPSVVKTSPEANASIYEDISQVSVQLSDGDGSGVDLKGTEVILQGPKAQVQANRSDGSDNTITLTFSKLLDTGNYTIQVTPKDRAGNTGYIMQAKFSYVLKAPAVKSVELTNKSYIHDLSIIEAVLEDRSGIGLDLSETGSTIVVKDSNGKQLQGDQTSNGIDTIAWRPVHPLAADGTDDGTYTVTVTPMDSLGTVGQSREYTLIYDTQPPRVLSASPADIYANVTFKSIISSVSAKLSDDGPAGLKAEDQLIYLEAPDGSQVTGEKSDNGTDTVTWNLSQSLARDGSADGKYNIVVKATDKAGSQKEFRYPIIYDTVPPQVISIAPEDNSIQTKSITEISANIKDSGEGRIDFEVSSIELYDPGNSKVEGLLANNGLDTMTMAFPNLESSGIYTIRVSAVDMAGNKSTRTAKFVFRTGLPVVVSTVPVTKPVENAYVNQQITEVRAILQETDGGGIDLSATGSKIELKGPDGNLVIGTQGNDGRNTLIYSLGKPLANNGADDGIYIIQVTAVNSAKRQDQTKEFSFTYDMQAPEVISATSPLNIYASMSYISSQITELQVKMKDKGPAGIDLDRSTIRLTDPNNRVVEGTSSNSDSDTLILAFPSGLPMEGTYTLSVVAVDKAGNSKSQAIKFIYGISVPKVVSTTPATIPAEKAFVRTQVKEVKAILSETGNSGIDFSSTGSTIKLTGSKGELPGIQSNDGNETLILALTKPLALDGSDDGVYTISVTPANAAKLKGQKVDLVFTYDTVSPKVDIDDIDLWYSGEAGSSLSKISAVLGDNQPSSGFDWDNADNTWIRLQDSSGKDIPGAVSVDKDKSEIYLLLDVPLASNGSDDGFYNIIVNPKDKAGNTPDPAVQHRFLYDTKPPTLSKAEIMINDKSLLLDSSLEDYPTSVNTKNGITIYAKMSDDGIGPDLTKSSITVFDPKGNKVTGSLMQDGKETIWFATGLLSEEGLYKVTINPVDLDENGQNSSSESVSTEFLFELGKPEAEIIEPGIDSADAKSENKHIIIKGSATDASTSQGVLASGIAKVEVGGIGPGGKEIEWIEANDDEKARGKTQEKLSRWYVNFLPDESGLYKIRLRVWDKAGNYAIYDTGLELDFTISLSFQDSVYCWPNPVTNGVAHISFKVNTPGSQNVNVTLYVYDISGDLVYEKDLTNVPTGTRMSTEWECINSSSKRVATGIYIFRLKAELPDGSEAVYKVGKPMVIKN